MTVTIPTSLRGLQIDAASYSDQDRELISTLRVAVISTRWNYTYVSALESAFLKTLESEYGVTDVTREFVGGAYELPYTAALMADRQCFHVIICIGCLIKGDTMHFEYISDAVANGMMRVMLDFNQGQRRPPIINGVLNVLSEEQAVARTGEKEANKQDNEGIGWAKTAVQQGLLYLKYRKNEGF